MIRALAIPLHIKTDTNIKKLGEIVRKHCNLSDRAVAELTNIDRGTDRFYIDI